MNLGESGSARRERVILKRDLAYDERMRALCDVAGMAPPALKEA